MQELVRQGWHVLCDLLEQRHRTLRTAASSPAFEGEEEHDNDEDEMPLLFRDCTMISMEERLSKYSFLHSSPSSSSTQSQSQQQQEQPATAINLWAAFLDGCSVVLNHCDRQSPWVAALCEDLQRSVPHAYANAYLTPAAAQTVPAHADDRDVFVVQVYGSKHWRVYRNIPVPYPYPHEQVGKHASLPVPDSVLKGPLLLERTLQPGDVLYLPRGYVHEAAASTDCCSLHVTVALATHDWSLAGTLVSAAEHAWSRELALRRAVDRQWGRRRRVTPAAAEQLQADLDRALQLLRDEITVPNVETALRNKYDRHNQRAARVRRPLLAAYDKDSARGASSSAATATTTTNKNDVGVVGRAAAATVTLQTRLRAATLAEKEQLRRSTTTDAPRVGLHVRVETYDGILALLQQLQQPGTARSLEGDDDSVVVEMVDRNPLICPVTKLSLARRCVELGALAIAKQPG